MGTSRKRLRKLVKKFNHRFVGIAEPFRSQQHLMKFSNVLGLSMVFQIKCMAASYGFSHFCLCPLFSGGTSNSMGGIDGAEFTT